MGYCFIDPYSDLDMLPYFQDAHTEGEGNCLLNKTLHKNPVFDPFPLKKSFPSSCPHPRLLEQLPKTLTSANRPLGDGNLHDNETIQLHRFLKEGITGTFI